MISVDGSLFIQIINFVFLIWILNMLVYKPIRKVLSERKDKISGLEGSIDSIHNDAMEKNDAFASGIKEARARGFKEKESLVSAATEEEREVIAGINRKAQENLEEIRSQIAKDAENVRDALQKEIDEFADAIGRKILGRAI